MKAGLALALCLTACAPDPPDCHGVYHFHPSYPAAYRQDTLEGIARWNAFGAPITLSPDSLDTQCSFRSFPRSDPEYASIKSTHGEDFMAYHLAADGSIIVTTGDYTEECRALSGHTCIVGTVMHELGHAHGLHHTTADAVMNPYTVRDEFTAADVQ